MSTAALKRFMVELFGKRPEPWIELKTRDTAAEVITVSAAIAGRDSTLTILDSQLMKVFDLTTTRAPHHAPTRAFATPVPEAVVVAPPRTSSRLPWFVAGAAVLAAGGVLAWTHVSRDDGAAMIEPAAVAAPVVAPAPVPAPAPAPPPSPTRVEPASVDVPAREEPAKVRAAAPARAHRAAVEDLAAMLRAGKTDEVIAACRASARALAQNASTCTLAACQLHDATNARVWLARTSTGKRAAIAAQCASAGTAIEVAARPAAPPAKPCDDPMECRK
jgi:hypothetical protein